jgi:ElaB/YqjD/DUF883 family membrane-anchored ribosome-binding protein
MSVSSSTLHDRADTTVDELKALLREAETALSNVGAEAGDQVTGLRDRLRNALADGKATFNQAADLARRQAARADEMVRSNPYASIGVATGAGLLVGYLVARSCANGRD